MKPKMTISEFRQFIQEQVIKMYASHLVESGEEHRTSWKTPMHSPVPDTDSKEEEPSLAKQVYDEIEMRMRPTDTSLSYKDIHEISEEYGVDFEDVMNIMQGFLINRSKEEQEDLRYESEEVLKALESEGNTNPSFAEFIHKFNSFEHDYNHSPEAIRKEFDKLTKDPNQMALFEKKLKEDWFEGESLNSNCMDNPEVCMSKPSNIIQRQLKP